MKKLIALSALALSFGATATERTLSFNFNVKSSGADLYACNAGLMHENQEIVYNPGDTATTRSSTETHIPRNEMTTDQLGEVACSQFGGVDKFILDYSVTAGAGYDHHDHSAGEATSLHANAHACAYYAAYTGKVDRLSYDNNFYASEVNRVVNLSITWGSNQYDDYRVTTDASCGDNHNCSTVTVNNTDDYMTASYKKWVGNNPDKNPVLKNVTRVAGAEDYNTLFKNALTTEDAKWGSKVLTNVDFFLGSDLFGSEYFVDFCYRGNQIDYNGFNTVLKLKAEAMVKEATKYGKWSGLEANIEVVCNTEAGDFVESLTEAKQFKGVSKVATNINQTLSNDEVKNCHIRYSFNETNKTTLRPHELTDQKVYLYTSIKEHHRKSSGSSETEAPSEGENNGRD